MKRRLSIIFATIAWFAVITQYYLMIDNRVASISETTIRFFSFFTILTNTLVAVYFTLIMVQSKSSKRAIIHKPGTLTAITTYITIVGLVYQFVLRQHWHPQGLQMIVDELLHSVIPVLVIVYWFLYEHKKSVAYSNIPQWLIYPLLYLIYILVRGNISNFYPYPFVNVNTLGFVQVIINSIVLIVVFTGISALFIRSGKAISK